MRTYKRTIEAHSLGGLEVAVRFEDGTAGVFDFSPYIDYPCYASLKSQEVFSGVHADHGTLLWPGEIDIAPETVWMDAVKTTV